MMYKAKVAVCSEIRTTQSERHVEFLNVKTWWYVKKPLGFKRLIKTVSINCRRSPISNSITASSRHRRTDRVTDLVWRGKTFLQALDAKAPTRNIKGCHDIIR